MLKAFKFRMYPTDEQKKWLIQNFGCVRFTYNHLLLSRQETYKQLGVIDYSLTPAALKKRYSFLKEADSLALANAQLNLDRAFRNYFKGRASFPKLKSKKSMWQSYTTNNQGHTIYLEGNQLKLPKQKQLFNVHVHRPIEGTIRSATISSRYNEEFYVSFLCEVPLNKRQKTNEWVGIAYCPKGLVETSQKIEVVAPKLLVTNQKIAVAERKLSIRAKAAQQRKKALERAKNYQKQKRKVLNLYQKQKYQREDYLEQLSAILVNKFDYLFIESLPDEKLASDFSVQDWHKLLTKLRYKAEWYQKTFILINTQDIHSHSAQEKSRLLERIGKQLLFDV